jgi:hypothetical protein
LLLLLLLLLLLRIPLSPSFQSSLCHMIFTQFLMNLHAYIYMFLNFAFRYKDLQGREVESSIRYYPEGADKKALMSEGDFPQCGGRIPLFGENFEVFVQTLYSTLYFI